MFARLNLGDRAAWCAAEVISDGNKIVLAQWLMTGTRILTLYDSTRGIDVSAKTEIYALTRQFAQSGGAIFVLFDRNR